MRVARRSAWFVNLAGVAVAALAAGCWRRLNLDRPGGAAKNLDQLSSDSQAPAVPGGAAEAE